MRRRRNVVLIAPGGRATYQRLCKGRAVIAGIGESPYYERDKASHTEFSSRASRSVGHATNAGIEPADVDAFVTYMDARNDSLRIASGSARAS